MQNGRNISKGIKTCHLKVYFCSQKSELIAFATIGTDFLHDFCTGSAVPRGGEHDQRQSRQPLPRVGCAHRALLTLYLCKDINVAGEKVQKMHFLKLMTSINEFWYFLKILSTRLFFCVFLVLQKMNNLYIRYKTNWKYACLKNNRLTYPIKGIVQPD